MDKKFFIGVILKPGINAWFLSKKYKMLVFFRKCLVQAFYRALIIKFQISIYRERKQLKILISKDIIEKSNGYFSSPRFSINKKNDDLRLVVDYKKIIVHVIDDPWEIPNVFRSIKNMKQCCPFSLIVLKNGFNQIVFDDESRRITGLNILGQHYQYKGIPF
ncbi:Retrovirus-related Pol polyprotein from transposon [Dictyocoela muelleri]|nr:Retrovirus-related Pol polyprotein from transposon [Dictyocoela muelleri]